MSTTKKPPRRPKPEARVSARRDILALWRGVDLEPLEIAAARSARAAGQVLPRVLQELRIDQRRFETEVVKVWNHALDPVIAQHAQPVGLRNGTLFVNVDHSAWLSEIVRYRRKEILERLQLSFGPEFIARISFRLG